MNGKLNRIEEQEQQLLQKYANNNFNRDNAQDVFKDWVQVDETTKKGKRKKKHQSKKLNQSSVVADNSMVDTPSNTTPITPDSEFLATLINQDDYVIKYKSKKKKKQHRALDEDLAQSISNLKTNGTAKESILHEIQGTSKTIKKEKQRNGLKKKKKNRKKKDCDDTIESTPGRSEDVEIKDTESCDQSVKYLKTHNKNTENIDQPDTAASSNKKRKRKSSKRDKKQCLYDDTNDLSSNEDGDDGMKKCDRLLEYVKNEVERQPRKKLKIVAKNLTPFQSKHLQKAGIKVEIVENTGDTDNPKIKSQMQKIVRKMENAMNFKEEDEDSGQDVVDAGIEHKSTERKKKNKHKKSKK